MSMDMLDSLFPDSLWKHGSLTDPIDEETYQEEAKRKQKAQRDIWIKHQKTKARKGRPASKLHPAQRKLDKRRRDMIKLRQKRIERLISEMPTAADLQRRREKSALLKKKRLVIAKRMKIQALAKARKARTKRLLSLRLRIKSALLKMKRLVIAKKMRTQALVKAREVRTKRLLSEISSSTSNHLRTKKSKTSKKQEPHLDSLHKLTIETRKWSQRIAKLSAQEATTLKHRSVVKAVPPMKKPSPKYPY
jgi:hypothetical protein